MTHEPTNADRAEWARVAIAAFAAETHLDTSGELEHDLESVVCDLVADLMHFCDEESLDWKEIIRRAELHHSEEVEQADNSPSSPYLAAGEDAYRRRFATRIIKAIILDQNHKVIPGDIKSFADLHNHVDANERYLIRLDECPEEFADSESNATKVEKQVARHNAVMDLVNDWMNGKGLPKR